jgi:hypothetical protein
MSSRFRMRRLAVTLVVSAVAVAAYGCSGSTKTNIINPDAGNGGEGGTASGESCTPGTKECVNDALARVCPSDGTGWLAQRCGVGKKCVQGDCVGDSNATCMPNTGSCVSATVGVRCNDNSQGYKQVTCPAGSVCTGAGLCVGTCGVVGGSVCADLHTVGACTGTTVTTTPCPSGQLCVTTQTTPYKTAACMPAACTPQTVAASFVATR